MNYGMVKLVLKQNRYFVETFFPVNLFENCSYNIHLFLFYLQEIIEKLLQDIQVKQCRVISNENQIGINREVVSNKNVLLTKTNSLTKEHNPSLFGKVNHDAHSSAEILEPYGFEVIQNSIELLRRR